MLDWLRKRWRKGRVHATSTPSADPLVELGRKARALAKEGFVDEAAAVLRASDNPRAEGMLALLLREYGRLDEAIDILRASKNPEAAPRLDQFLRERGSELNRLTIIDGRPLDRTREVDELLQHGQIDEAIDLLKASRLPADRSRLQALLRELGRTDDLRELANHSIRLGTLRAEGRLDELRQRASAGDREAETLLIDALAEQGQVEELRTRADAGNSQAKDLLVDLLAREGRLDELSSLHDPYAAAKVFDHLIEQGLADEAAAVLREEPSSEDDMAWYRLARLYADQGRTDDALTVLRPRQWIAPDLLAELLADSGEATEAIAVLDASDRREAPRLAARLRAEHGQLDELRARADAGDKPSAKQLAAYLAAHDEVDELRARAAADGDAVFKVHLIRTLGRLGRLQDLEALAPTSNAAGHMWWATLLAGGGDPTEHEAKQAWYAGQDATARVIHLLVEKQRIDVAIAFAKARVSAGDEWAGAWIPRVPQSRIHRDDGIDSQLLASQADAAIRELLPTCSVGEERSTKVRVADAGYAVYGDLRVSLTAPGQAEVSLACWTVNLDTARYFGDSPPEEAETRLPPEGTAVPDLRMTIAVLDDIADRLKAVDAPRPQAGGSHLTLTVSARAVGGRT
ncbi:hypothetical protein [Kribbella sp. NPDC023855]|uniref:hypothetical protein n=1 Tax=Kribbella sp. NPDC023855 TaxID=3154698 RepID=UPI0033D64606